MSAQASITQPTPRSGVDHRSRLLAGLPVAERRLRAGGLSTALLEGGEGPPLVLLHGPGESSVNWIRVLPELAIRYHVIAPDLPAHGATDAGHGPLDARRVLAWLGELIDQTCRSRPALVGHVLGGAIAARFAVAHGGRLQRLVLVDSLGLAPFRPAPLFALSLLGFALRPSDRSYDRLMHQCSFSLASLREDMGDRWAPFAAYNLQLARDPKARAAARLMRTVGIPRIPPEDLGRITVPTALIWGRHDRANRLRIPEAASARYGWPLHVVEECADDPPRDRPREFVEALAAAIGTGADAR